MALKNSKTGSLPVSEIYNFMTEHFPYFKVSPRSTPILPSWASQASLEAESSLLRVLCQEQRAQAIHPRLLSGLESDLMLVESGLVSPDRLQEASTYPEWGERAWEEMRDCPHPCPQDAGG